MFDRIQNLPFQLKQISFYVGIVPKNNGNCQIYFKLKFKIGKSIPGMHQ